MLAGEFEGVTVGCDVLIGVVVETETFVGETVGVVVDCNGDGLYTEFVGNAVAGCKDVGSLVGSFDAEIKVGDTDGIDETKLADDGESVDGTSDTCDEGNTVSGVTVESKGTVVGTALMNGTVGLPDGVLEVALK